MTRSLPDDDDAVADGSQAGTVLTALGDSISCGEGVGLRVAPDRTWPALLTSAVPGGRLHPFATAGARVRDLRATQLPAALAARPDVATVLVGLNDIARGGFDAHGFADDLAAVVRGLADAGALVLLGRLHDPCAVLPLPRAMSGAVRARWTAVNEAVDRLRPYAVVLDLGELSELGRRAGFAVDRLHPHAGTHAAMAAAAAAALRSEGLAVGTVPSGPVQRPAGPVRTAWWAGRHALPWLVARRHEVALPALTAALGR